MGATYSSEPFIINDNDYKINPKLNKY